jgi:NADH:ubiquinone oxidoreductase subunit C
MPILIIFLQYSLIVFKSPFALYQKKSLIKKTFIKILQKPKHVYSFLTILRATSYLKTLPHSVDMFSYELLGGNSIASVYIFFSLDWGSELILVTLHRKERQLSGQSSGPNSPPSVASLFSNYWWLERESSELLGVNFEFKYDSRNLLLEYTNVLKPLSRFFPSVGFFEFFFNCLLSRLVSYYPSLQV